MVDLWEKKERILFVFATAPCYTEGCCDAVGEIGCVVRDGCAGAADLARLHIMLSKYMYTLYVSTYICIRYDAKNIKAPET